MKNINWTDEHLKTFLDSIKYVDGSCSTCIRSCIGYFLDNTSWDLLKDLDRVGPLVKWDYDGEWGDVRPNKDED